MIEGIVANTGADPFTDLAKILTKLHRFGGRRLPIGAWCNVSSILGSILALGRVEQPVDRSFRRRHRRIAAVRCPGPGPCRGVDRPLPEASPDALDNPIFDAAIFHAFYFKSSLERGICAFRSGAPGQYCRQSKLINVPMTEPRRLVEAEP